MVDDNKVKQIVEEFNRQNGNREFSQKDLIIYFNTEQSERTERIEKKFDEHIVTCNKGNASVWKAISQHDKIIQHITDDIPEKGFCDKTQNIINCWHPDTHEPPLNKKVETLWYDRKMLKYLTGALIVSIFASIGSIVISFIIK